MRSTRCGQCAPFSLPVADGFEIKIQPAQSAFGTLSDIDFNDVVFINCDDHSARYGTGPHRLMNLSHRSVHLWCVQRVCSPLTFLLLPAQRACGVQRNSKCATPRILRRHREIVERSKAFLVENALTGIALKRCASRAVQIDDVNPFRAELVGANHGHIDGIGRCPVVVKRGVEQLAPVEGLEPSRTVLETVMLPLHHTGIGTGVRSRTASSGFTVRPLIAVEHRQHVGRACRA